MDFQHLQTAVGIGVLRTDLQPYYGDFVNQALREAQNRFSFREMKNVVYVTTQPGVLGAGGNLVPVGAVWPTGTGTLQFQVLGFTVGAQYYFNQGNASNVSADGTTPLSTPNGFFTATQTSYYLLGNGTLVQNQLITAALITSALDQVAVLPVNFKELQKRESVLYVSDDGQLIPATVVFEYQQARRIWAFGGTPLTTWPPRVFYERRGTQSVIGILEPTGQHFNMRVQYYGYLPNLVNPTDVSPIALAYPNMIINKAKAIAFGRINDPAAVGFEQLYENDLKNAKTQEDRSEYVGRSLHM